MFLSNFKAFYIFCRAPGTFSALQLTDAVFSLPPLPKRLNSPIMVLAGRSAVRLARSVRDAEVGGSNPLAPIFISKSKRNIATSLARLNKFGKKRDLTRAMPFSPQMHL